MLLLPCAAPPFAGAPVSPVCVYSLEFFFISNAFRSAAAARPASLPCARRARGGGPVNAVVHG